MAKEYLDLTGQRFGNWVVLSEAEPRYYAGRRVRYWNCVCCCGTNRAVQENNLKQGTSKSCGCDRYEKMHKGASLANTTHGQSNNRIYRIFKHMHNRCYNKADIRYDKYGGRGITVCEDWKKFEPFYEWAMSHGYNDTLSIDRIDVDGPYCPENCRWATAREQSVNKTSNVLVTYNGTTKTVAEWAEELGMPYKKLWKRIHKGMSPELAFA